MSCSRGVNRSMAGHSSITSVVLGSTSTEHMLRYLDSVAEGPCRAQLS